MTVMYLELIKLNQLICFILQTILNIFGLIYIGWFQDKLFDLWKKYKEILEKNRDNNFKHCRFMQSFISNLIIKLLEVFGGNDDRNININIKSTKY